MDNITPHVPLTRKDVEEIVDTKIVKKLEEIYTQLYLITNSCGITAECAELLVKRFKALAKPPQEKQKRESKE